MTAVADVGLSGISVVMAAGGNGEARSAAADSAVVLRAVYSSQAPQECVNNHNSDHLTMRTTRRALQGALASTSFRSSRDCRSLLPVPHTNTLQIPF